MCVLFYLMWVGSGLQLPRGYRKRLLRFTSEQDEGEALVTV